jgi:hypothetical protein
MNPSRAAALVAGVLALALGLPASAGAAAHILPGQSGLKDLDTRTGRLAPTAAQKQEVASLGARAEWNRYGTPASLIADDGFLGAVSAGSAATVARDSSAPTPTSSSSRPPTSTRSSW